MQIVQRVLQYVEVELEIISLSIKYPHLLLNDATPQNRSNLRWSTRGAKAAIIELITALHATGEITTMDGRQVQDKDFVEAFESMFNISLENYRNHKNILVNRKLRSSPFLDRLAQLFSSYCENKQNKN